MWWALSILLFLFLAAVLAAHLLRVRVELQYAVPWKGSAHAQVSFLSWNKCMSLLSPEEDDGNPAKGGISTSPPTKAPLFPDGSSQAGFLRLPRIRFDKERWKKASFKLATDRQFLAALIGYLWSMAKRFIRLLGPEVELYSVKVGHPDPLVMGKIAGALAAIRPLSPWKTLGLDYDFRKHSFAMEGSAAIGFSLLQMVRFFAAIALRFPWFTLILRLWQAWRHPELNKWQNRIYVKLTQAT